MLVLEWLRENFGEFISGAQYVDRNSLEMLHFLCTETSNAIESDEILLDLMNPILLLDGLTIVIISDQLRYITFCICCTVALVGATSKCVTTG
jgi:hypothetical protein